MSRFLVVEIKQIIKILVENMSRLYIYIYLHIMHISVN